MFCPQVTFAHRGALTSLVIVSKILTFWGKRFLSLATKRPEIDWEVYSWEVMA
jgi:hypothetical protein